MLHRKPHAFLRKRQLLNCARIPGLARLRESGRAVPTVYDSRSTEEGTLVSMIYHYDCDRCGLHRDLRILPREYRLDDHRTLPMKQRHLWCAVCNDISVCESLTQDDDEQEYYQERLRKLRPLRDNPPADLSSLGSSERTDVEFAAEWIRDIEQAMSDWHEWRSRRQAPSHCLRCDVPVEYVPVDGAD